MQNNIDIQRIKLTDKDKDIIGRKCGCCESTVDLQYHHIVPLALGGSNLLTNYVCLCKKCHNVIHTGISTISYGHLKRTTESTFPFESNDFAKACVLYAHRLLTQEQAAKMSKTSRPTFKRWFDQEYYKALRIYKEVENNEE